MTALSNTRPVNDDAQLHAQQSPHYRANTFRVLVRRTNSKMHTTVSGPDDWFERAKHFAGTARAVRTALRNAALQVKEYPVGRFSHLVRRKAMASLRGNYRPASQEATARFAAENNWAWEAAQQQPGSCNGTPQNSPAQALQPHALPHQCHTPVRGNSSVDVPYRARHDGSYPRHGQEGQCADTRRGRAHARLKKKRQTEPRNSPRGAHKVAVELTAIE